VNSRSGAAVISPEKLLEGFAAHGNLRADTMVSTTLAAAQEFLDDPEVGYALSGSTSAVRYIVGRNTVADLGRRIIYPTRALSHDDFPVEGEVIRYAIARSHGRDTKINGVVAIVLKHHRAR